MINILWGIPEDICWKTKQKIEKYFILPTLAYSKKHFKLLKKKKHYKDFNIVKLEINI